MAEKKQEQDPRVTVEGKTFTFTTEDGDTLTIPLRVKMKMLRELNDVVLDAAGKYQTIEAIAPDQVATVDEMDANEFNEAFDLWQAAYSARAGASLGEPSGSSPS